MKTRYPFDEFEKEVSAQWEGHFSCDPDSTKPPYTIIMPPPNVTGYLHLGHAFSSTLQDILIRFKRMQGYDVLWLPGTDHAGIATQMMVEKQLASEGISRQQLGREAFLKRTWDWKEKYGDVIVQQMKLMGFSADWSSLCFTLDPTISEAVLHSFVMLHQKGLVYRAQRLINWDPVLKTAVSDLEVSSEERTDLFWTIRYDLEGGGSIDIATTRPETLFGDTAIAVHPKDPRYQEVIGKTAIVPLQGRRIPVIADESISPEKGTGAVKITPAHDFLDFEIAQRHGLEKIDIFDQDTVLTGVVPSAFQGLTADQARPKVLKALAEKCISEVSLTHSVPHSQRSGAILQPRLTYQWFIDMKEMAEKGLEAVACGQIQMIPAEWASNYRHWLENIQPWCISRQLWWGHQIPAWYGPEDSLFVATTEEEALTQARKVYGQDVLLRRDPDVLDTWFSSGLWPFSTLGWPEKTKKLARYYPSNILITGFDILFFWVARMIMLGIECTNQAPFHAVYLHPLLRDEKGQKMSKTKGNVINPLDVAKEYGVDALRFGLSWIAAPAQHVSFGMTHVEHARNFMTKLWNMSRFLILNDLISPGSSAPASPKWLWNQWILKALSNEVKVLTQQLETYRFHEAAATAYEATWSLFCDWYVECAKDALRHQPEWQEEIRATTTSAVRALLGVLHPFVPFITEKLWSLLGFEGLLCHQPWPVLEDIVLPEARQEAEWLKDLITQVRRVRSDFRLPSQPLTVYLSSVSLAHQDLLHQQQAFLCRFLKLQSLHFQDDFKKPEKGCVHGLVGEACISIAIGDLIEIKKEKDRLKKALEEAIKKQQISETRLSSADFLEKAPTEVIEELRQRCVEAKKDQAKYTSLLENLDA